MFWQFKFFIVPGTEIIKKILKLNKKPEDMMKINNAVALVTGANRGIGKALVAALDELAKALGIESS